GTWPAEVSLRIFILSIFLASAASAQNRVAVLPVQARSGALTPADAAAFTQEMRAAARDSLADRGYEVLGAEGSDPSDALERTGASLVVLGRAAQMEGATVVGIGLYKPGSSSPVSLIRVMGIGIAQLKTDVRAKLPGQLATALGLAPPAVEAKLPRGTLRIPGGTKQQPPEAPVSAPPPPAAPPPPTLVSPPPPADDPAQALLDVLDEQVAGFYDPFTKQLVVRKDPPASAGAMGPDGLRVILAHEIEHALQDQNFGIPDMSSLPDDDVRLARS